MKQLEFDFEALPEVVKEEKKVVGTVARLDLAEDKRLLWLEAQQLAWERQEYKAGRFHCSNRYRKIVLGT